MENAVHGILSEEFPKLRKLEVGLTGTSAELALA